MHYVFLIIIKGGKKNGIPKSPHLNRDAIARVKRIFSSRLVTNIVAGPDRVNDVSSEQIETCIKGHLVND